MPTNLAWTMNCILAGAKIRELVASAKEDEALEYILGLSSEFDETSARYLLGRLKEGKTIGGE